MFIPKRSFDMHILYALYRRRRPWTRHLNKNMCTVSMFAITDAHISKNTNMLCEHKCLTRVNGCEMHISNDDAIACNKCMLCHPIRSYCSRMRVVIFKSIQKYKQQKKNKCLNKPPLSYIFFF